MSRWSSERAIVRDLRLAQAGAAPAPAPRVLRAAERPPRAAPPQQEYSGRGAGAEPDKPLRPDLSLIRRMLDMVRDLNASEGDLIDTDVSMISKLNPTCPEFIPTKKLSVKNGKTKKNKHNVALESILETLELQEQAHRTEVVDVPLNLLKPEDLIPSRPGPANCRKACGAPEMDTSQEKVQDWLMQMNSHNKIKQVSDTLESSNMFKRKSKPTTEAFLTCVKTQDIQENKPAKDQADRRYIPSTRADDYYKKYLDKSQLMESLHDDIWTKAEKKMKEIDERRFVQFVFRSHRLPRIDKSIQVDILER